VNLLVGRARIFVYYIRYTNVRAGIFGPIEPSAQTTRVAHVQRDTAAFVQEQAQQFRRESKGLQYVGTEHA